MENASTPKNTPEILYWWYRQGDQFMTTKTLTDEDRYLDWKPVYAPQPTKGD